MQGHLLYHVILHFVDWSHQLVSCNHKTMSNMTDIRGQCARIQVSMTLCAPPRPSLNSIRQHQILRAGTLA